MENLDRYFKDIRKSSPLTSEEEKELAYKIQDGDEKALNALVEANLKFVVSIARQYQGRGISLEDLICEGNIGLIEAAKRFDPEKEFRFISYAVFWIKQAILAALSNTGSIRLPFNRVVEISKIRSLREKAAREGRSISDTEIAKILDVPVSEIVTLDKATAPTLSFEFSLTGEEGGTTLEEVTPCKDFEVDAEMRKESLSATLRLLMKARLEDRELKLIQMTFGIDCPTMNEEEISRELGISEERVRQIRVKAINKLRQNGPLLKALRGYLN